MAMNFDVPGIRLADRRLFLVSAILFPLFILIGYFRSYYFSAFFDVKPLANTLVHAHGLVMSLWVIYFTAQVALIRTKNIKLHMSMGLAGVILAVIVFVVGMATAIDAHLIRLSAPAGIHPFSFFTVPLIDMLLFAIFFSGAVIYRKRPAEHKTLMLMTAINFLPAAVARMPLLPEHLVLLQACVIPDIAAIAGLIWHSRKHGKVNKAFALAVFIFIVSQPLRIALGMSDIWLRFMAWVVS